MSERKWVPSVWKSAPVKASQQSENIDLTKPGGFRQKALNAIDSLKAATKDPDMKYNGAYLTAEELKNVTSRIEQFLLIHRTQSNVMLGQKGLSRVNDRSLANAFTEGYVSLRDARDALHDSTERSQVELLAACNPERLGGIILQQLQTSNVRASLPPEAEEHIRVLSRLHESLAAADPLDPSIESLLNETHDAFDGMKTYIENLYHEQKIGDATTGKAITGGSAPLRKTWKLIAQDWDNAIAHFAWSIRLIEGFGERVDALQEDTLRLDEAIRHNVAVEKVEHMVSTLRIRMRDVRSELQRFAHERARGPIAVDQRILKRIDRTLNLLSILEEKWGAIPILGTKTEVPKKLSDT